MKNDFWSWLTRGRGESLKWLKENWWFPLIVWPLGLGLGMLFGNFVVRSCGLDSKAPVRQDAPGPEENKEKK